MVIHNESDRTDSQVEGLIDFCRPYFTSEHLASLFLYTSDRSGEHTAGWADKFHIGVAILDGVPSSILLRLSKGMEYPYRNTYRKSVGEIVFANWREEFLFVLAHEMRHIDQFWSGDMPRHYEVDAESYALLVLSEYRESIRYKRAA